MKNIEVTIKNFNRALTDTFRSIRNSFGRIQALTLFGVREFAESGNTIYLTKILRHAVDTPGVNALHLQAYIQHVANVQWTTDKIGDKVFKKKDKDADAILNADAMDQQWNLWAKENVGGGTAKADWELGRYAVTAFNTVTRHDKNLDDFIKELRKVARAAKAA